MKIYVCPEVPQEIIKEIKRTGWHSITEDPEDLSIDAILYFPWIRDDFFSFPCKVNDPILPAISAGKSVYFYQYSRNGSHGKLIPAEFNDDGGNGYLIRDHHAPVYSLCPETGPEHIYVCSEVSSEAFNELSSVYTIKEFSDADSVILMETDDKTSLAGRDKWFIPVDNWQVIDSNDRFSGRILMLSNDMLADKWLYVYRDGELVHVRESAEFSNVLQMVKPIVIPPIRIRQATSKVMAEANEDLILLLGLI